MRLDRMNHSCTWRTDTFLQMLEMRQHCWLLSFRGILHFSHQWNFMGSSKFSKALDQVQMPPKREAGSITHWEHQIFIQVCFQKHELREQPISLWRATIGWDRTVSECPIHCSLWSPYGDFYNSRLSIDIQQLWHFTCTLKSTRQNIFEMSIKIYPCIDQDLAQRSPNGLRKTTNGQLPST